MIDTNYFLYQLRQNGIRELSIAKKYFFEEYFKKIKTEPPIGQSLEEQILQAQQIKVSYFDAEHKRMRFRLPYIEYEPFNDPYDHYHPLNIYNQHGEYSTRIFGWFSHMGLEEFIRINAKISTLVKLWEGIEPEVRKICEEMFRIYREDIVNRTNAGNANVQEVLQQNIIMLLQHYLDEWPDETRELNEILSDFAKEGYPFPKSDTPCRDFGQVRISYFYSVAEIQYNGMPPIGCKKRLNSKRCFELASVVQHIYEETQIISDETLRILKLRNINKKAMETLLENRMKELSLEYTTNLWQNNKDGDGIELKIKCKKRRCLTLPIHYDYMDQFQKMMDELPQIMENVNNLQSIKQIYRLPFNATVSSYGNNANWKKNF